MNRPRLLRCLMYSMRNWYNRNPIFMTSKKFYENQIREQENRPKVKYHIIAIPGIGKKLKEGDPKTGKDLGDSCS